ncbi:MAG: cell division protein SepF [Acidimicrobiaceae bacterium]|nr:cell division protein SepF [Acidimicrobiaceae bacterium]
MLKKAMIYLGLGPDEHYESYEDPIRPSPAPAAAPGRYAGRAETAPGLGVSVASGPAPDSAVMGRTVRPISLASAEDGMPMGDPDAEASVRVVHSMPSKAMKPHAVSPDAFNDAQEIGDRFKSGQPVIVNLQAVDRDLRRRLVDFSSGLCYAMGGKMDRVADQVYLLTPADVEVSRGTARRKRG